MRAVRMYPVFLKRRYDGGYTQISMYLYRKKLRAQPGWMAVAYLYAIVVKMKGEFQ